MRMILNAALLSLAVAGAGLTGAARAEEGDDNPETPALLAYLGLTAADGKNTVGEGAGAIEGHMLASTMAVKAASVLETRLQSPMGRIVLLTGNESFSLAEYHQAKRQLDMLVGDRGRFLAHPAVQRCEKALANPQPPKSGAGVKSFTEMAEAKPPKFDFQPSDILGAIRTSSSFSPVSVTLGAQLLKSALLSRATAKEWVVPSDISVPTGGDPLFDTLNSIRNSLAPYADGRCDKSDEAIKKTAAALMGKADGLVASKEGAPSLLDKAALAGSIMKDGADVKVLRVDVDKAGGTLVDSSNIFTSLGVPGTTMRGGMVVSYRLIDPASGRTHVAGLILCRVPQKLLKSITSKDIPADDVTCKAIT